MTSKHGKIILFAYGLLTGIIICLIVIFIQFRDIENFIEKKMNIGNIFKKPNIENFISQREDVKKDRFMHEGSKPIMELPPDTISNQDVDLKDSFLQDSIGYGEELNPGQEIVVVRDELLFSKTIIAKGGNQSKISNSYLDSLLIDNKSSVTGDNIFRVEFWKSPLNYKGYKLLNNRLILFGIFKYNDIELYFSERTLHLVIEDMDYPLEVSDDFHPFIGSKRK